MSIILNDVGYGRLCNQIIRSIALSMIAQNNDLYTEYRNYNIICKVLGINLFCGTKKYDKTVIVKNDNYLNLLHNSKQIDYNLNLNFDFFQTEEIINLIYEYLNLEENKKNIINHNPFKDRYNNNNDLFIHIRLGDVANRSPGIQYYLKVIKQTSFENLYIASDSLNNTIIKDIQKIYPNAILVNKTPEETIQFGSTCKNIILSHGSFSTVIGYLAFFSKHIYYPNFDTGWAPPALFMHKLWIPCSKD